MHTDRNKNDPGKPLRGKTCLVTGAAIRLGRASALALAHAGADVAITFRTSARDAQRTVIDLTSLGVRAFALHCDITDEASVKSMMKEAGRELGLDRHPGQQRGQLRHRRFRTPHRPPMGCHVRLQHSRTIPGLARSPEMDAPKTNWVKTNSIAPIGTSRGQNHQHGIARRPAPLAHARPLLLFQGSPAHAHQGDGKSSSSRNRRKRGRARHDRSRREIGGRFHAPHGQANSDAAQRKGR